MEDRDKTKDQLIQGLAEMHRQVEELKRSETERNRAEESLRWSERRYRTYVDLTKQFAWVTDASAQVVEDVPAFRRFTGQTYEEVKGIGWSKALHGDDLQRTLAVWSEAVPTRTTYEIEFRMRRHDGVYVTLLAKSVPILSDDGLFLGNTSHGCLQTRNCWHLNIFNMNRNKLLSFSANC